jgi:hypothetical protein
MLLLCLMGASVDAAGAASGLAGRAVTIPAAALYPGGEGQYFEWCQFTGMPETSRFAELELAIIPFEAGMTLVGLDDENGATFINLEFQDGWMDNELQYDSALWNVVRLSMDFLEQEYRVEVNGVEAGPFPFDDPADSIQAFRINHFGGGSQALTGWFDSIELSARGEPLLLIDFDGNASALLGVCEWCTLVPSEPGSEPPPPYSNQTRPASRYEGLAARAESVVDEHIPIPPQSFEWYQYFGAQTPNPGQMVELSLAIVPFAGEFGASTSVGLDGDEGATFASVGFDRGRVMPGDPPVDPKGPGIVELVYDPTNWNLVKLAADFGSQSYTIAVNGAETGPFRFYAPSTFVQAFRLNGGSRNIYPVVAWIDSVNVSIGRTPIVHYDFERAASTPVNVAGRGKLTIEDPASGNSERNTEIRQANLKAQRTSQGLMLSWLDTPGVILEVSDSVSGPWRPWEGEVTSDSDSLSVRLAPASAQAFYRLASGP